MKTHTQVAVIGGGVVGCSVLYHLTKYGWKDVMLIERSTLTSGSTWHAAGGFHTLNGDTNMAALQGYTIQLYKELEKITGMSCGLHHVGGITLADNQARFEMLKAERAKHRYMELHTEILSPEEVKTFTDGLVNTDGIIGALYDPLDGHLDPSGTTHAYAKAAKMQGATIVEHNRVLETNPRPDGSWELVTEQGTIIAEHIVNAGGLWAREVGAMAGVYLPLLPMAHQYLVTDDIPEIMDILGQGREFPHYVAATIDRSVGRHGRQSLRFDLNGGQAAYYSPLLRIDDLHSYYIRGALRTTELHDTAALISVSLLDQKRRRIRRYLSKPVTGTHKNWVEVSIGPFRPDADSCFLVVGCHIVNSDRSDIRGQVWFDDIWVGGLPRLVLTPRPNRHYFMTGQPLARLLTAQPVGGGV
mgnify:CR=1 FL=1